jgi:WD40 repeat protein
LWNLKNGEMLWSRTEEGRYLQDATFSPNGQMVACVSNDHLIILLDAESGSLLKTLGIPKSAMTALAFSRQQSTLVVGSKDGAMRQWNTRFGALEKTYASHTSEITSIQYSPDETLLMSGSKGFNATERTLLGTLKVQNAADNSLVWESPHKGCYHRVALSADGDFLAYAGNSELHRHVRRDDWRKQTLNFDERSRSVIAFSPDGKALAIAASHKTDGEAAITLRDAQTGKILRSISPPDERNGYESAVFSPDGKTLACGGAIGSNRVRLWDVQAGRSKRTFRADECPKPQAFSPDGKILAVTVLRDDNIWIYNVRTGKKQILRGHSGSVNFAAFSPDGRILASASFDGTVKLWDMRDWNLLLTLLVLPSENPGEVSQEWLAYTPDGYYTGSADSEKYIRWNLGTKIYPADKYKRSRRKPERIRKLLAEVLESRTV